MSSPLPLPSPENDYHPPVGTRLNVATWIAVFSSIGERLRASEAYRPTLDGLINELQVFGLQRLDEAIVPLVQTQETRLATLVANVDALEEQMEEILLGVISASLVTETETRVFVTPAQRDMIATLVAAVAALAPKASPIFEGPAKFEGIRAKVISHGSVTTGTENFDAAAGSVHILTVAGAHAWSFSGWGSEASEIEIHATNAGAAALTLPTVRWSIGDGTWSTTFADMGVELQASGRNTFCIWTTDGGTTLYGRAA